MRDAEQNARWWSGLVPALLLSILVTGAVAAKQSFPTGQGTVLVPLGPDGLAPLAAPGLERAAMVDAPAPGWLVLRGDAGAIRAAFGRALAWRAPLPCAARS